VVGKWIGLERKGKDRKKTGRVEKLGDKEAVSRLWGVYENLRSFRSEPVKGFQNGRITNYVVTSPAVGELAI
jgi:hypothetical protein